jgi:endonuclease YncB( thermonuclease family)
LGRRVKLVTDPTQDIHDRYGRLLADANVIGGPSLQIAILRKGWAKVYVYAGKPFVRIKPFRRAERSAREADRGRGRSAGPLSQLALATARGGLADETTARRRLESGLVEAVREKGLTAGADSAC